MITSLYACGPARIEIGRYGADLPTAVNLFLTTAKKLGLKPVDIVTEAKRTVIKFDHHSKGLYKLLEHVAVVMDVHGDPPYRYILTLNDVPDGEYIKTCTYND